MTAGTAGPTEKLATIVTSVRYDDIPSAAVDVGRAAILDGIGNMLAGSAEPLGAILTDFVKAMGGSPTSSLIGTGFKTCAPYAALANAAFAHSMDYEIMWVPPTHPTSPVLPALLALAELEGGAGRAILRALVLGFEVQGRLNLAVQGTEKKGFRFHPPSTLGIVGSAVACSLFLGLDTGRLRTAMGIASSRAGGLVANTGSMSKSQHSANAARAGVESALLARAGYTANESILEVPYGLADAVFGPGFDFDAVTDDFGKPYRMVDPGLAFKFYPAQFTTHWGIQAALDVRGKHDVVATRVAHVLVRVGNPNWSAPRTSPESGLEGKFSIPYTVALALLDGGITIDSFTDDRRFAPDVEAMLGRIEVIEDDAIPPGLDFANTWAEVTVTMDDGRRLTERCVAPRGRWDRPLTRAERLLKFHDCAKRRLRRADADRVVEIVEEFEGLKTVEELMDIIRTPEA